ncbi:MAG: hypothetical protein JKY71_08135 [Alphaproteobacteria bacterium]|nr:hypothetical protein [Alphaproteobacteria bacterium]
MCRTLLMIALFVTGISISPKPAWALSCAEPDYAQIVEDSDLIAKALILEVEEFPDEEHVTNNREQTVKFEIQQVYKGDDTLKGTQINVRVSSFKRVWGPKLSEGQEDEFLFVYNDEAQSWYYRGPGGCTYLNDDVWQALRTQSPLPVEN